MFKTLQIFHRPLNGKERGDSERREERRGSGRRREAGAEGGERGKGAGRGGLEDGMRGAGGRLMRKRNSVYTRDSSQGKQ